MNGNKFGAVCTCNTCSGKIEFESANTGQTVQCPHCGMDTVLFIPQVSPRLQPIPAAPVLASNLIKCPDCGNEISRLADACPKCGRPIMAEARRVERDLKKSNTLVNVIWITIFVLGALFFLGYTIHKMNKEAEFSQHITDMLTGH